MDYNEKVYVIDSSNAQRGIDGTGNTSMFCRVWRNDLNSYHTYVSYSQSGELNITRRDLVIDSYNISSGEFHCKLINIRNPSDTIQITSGRFDLESYSLRNAKFD
jgi:hypothetical protein